MNADDEEEVRARLAAIVESSDDAIVSKTLDGTIRSWNAGAQRIFGYSPDEAVGRSITLIIPTERLDEERGILERLCRGERIEHFETVRVAKDGRRIDVSITVSPVRDREGRIIGASKIGRDISAQKRMAEELRRKAEELAEADRKKDDFIALLAHELRNPLAPLRSGLQVLRLAADDPSAVEKTRAMMDRQLVHLVRLIDDLLDVSRLNRNKLNLQRSRVALAEVVSHAVETAAPAIEAAGHELTVSLPPDAVLLDADLTRLAQVLGNLLTNSAKYTERGGHITLAATAHADEVVVTVRDTGIGIPAEALPHIFNLFAQVGRTHERASGGLGIGLALVKGLTEMHGGTVTAESEGPGRGSTFTIRLPRAGRVSRPSPLDATGDTSQRWHADVKVLVVDDNHDGAETMATMLTLLGHEVYKAHDGAEAIEAAERIRPELILMDIGMPQMNGLDATRAIRARPWSQGTTIVALTGWGQEGDRERSQAAGCDGHLVKPVGLTELEVLLADLPRRAQ